MLNYLFISQVHDVLTHMTTQVAMSKKAIREYILFYNEDGCLTIEDGFEALRKRI